MVEQQTSVGVVEVTPNGLPIYFQYEPRRYRLGPQTDDEAVWNTRWEKDEPDWPTVPSVSEVLDELRKDGLPWWGMVTGVEGVMQLLQLGQLKPVMDGNRVTLGIPGVWRDGMPPPGSDDIVELLTQAQLTVNHVRDRAGDRGTAVHDALESWAKSGELPDLGMYGPDQVGYVKGLRDFLLDVQPEPIASEVMVGSREFGFAGRYDLRLRITQVRNVIARIYPKKQPLWKRLQPGEILTDLKTSKGVYESHARQLEGYEKASLESGWDETSARGILHVTEDGRYEFVRSWATWEDFLAVLLVWRSSQAMKAQKKAQR